MAAKYHRILLKISGEALAGDKGTGYDFKVMGAVCDTIRKCVEQGVQVGVVIGGGNFWRGVKNGEGYIERTRADRMGMLATVMNCLAVCDVLEQKGVPARVMTAMDMPKIAEPFVQRKALRHFEKGRVVIFAGGTGNPYFSTDSAAALRAAEIGADVILLAKNVDGVYSADPQKDPSATRYSSLTFDEAMSRNLGIMDATAFALCRDRKLPIKVFSIFKPGALKAVLLGADEGTLVHA